MSWKQATGSLALVWTWWLNQRSSNWSCQLSYARGDFSDTFSWPPQSILGIHTLKEASLWTPWISLSREDLRKGKLVIWTEVPLLQLVLLFSIRHYAFLIPLIFVYHFGRLQWLTLLYEPNLQSWGLGNYILIGGLSCFSSGYNSTRQYQEMSKGITWFPHVFLPVPLWKNSSVPSTVRTDTPVQNNHSSHLLVPNIG